jgi:hypothetical protein
LETFVSQRCTLTTEGISLLLKHEPYLIPEISVDEVKDKSKGSSFSKSIACIQAAWFCLSCIARASQILPISMLELNTFAHALCTVIVYTLWWRKPLDMTEPLILRDDRLKPLLAYMWVSTTTSCIPKPESLENISYTVGRDPEFEAIIDNRASSGVTASDVGVLNKAKDHPVNSPDTQTRNMPRTEDINVTTNQSHPSTGFRANSQSTRWKVQESHHEPEGGTSLKVYYKPKVFNLTPSDVRRWELVREAMDKYHLIKPNRNLDLVTIKPVAELMTGTNHGNLKTPSWAILGFSIVAV